jgi:hypothetical protein
MAKERELMRQKINVTPVLSAHYQDQLNVYTQNLITKYLLGVDDIGTEFTHNDRTFKIHGMTANEHMVVTEEIEGNLIYWECSAHFVQMKLDRKYVEWKDLGGKSTPIEKDYEPLKMYLPILKASRKKVVSDEETSDEPIMETYDDDSYEPAFETVE